MECSDAIWLHLGGVLLAKIPKNFLVGSNQIWAGSLFIRFAEKYKVARDMRGQDRFSERARIQYT